MKITILGCGSSAGVPHIGQPRPANPKNIRSRASVHVEHNNTALLIDTSPDLRHQAINTGITRIDSVLYTHTHADHVHGIDDIKSFNHLKQGQIDAYGDTATMQEITTRFAYCFRDPNPAFGWFRPALVAHNIEMLKTFTAGDLNITPFPQIHGHHGSVGYRITSNNSSFIYSTDVIDFPPESHPLLSGADVWVVDCLRKEPSPTHSHLEQTLGWIETFKPKKSYLTHMGALLDYDDLIKILPANVEPCYDGLIINC